MNLTLPLAFGMTKHEVRSVPAEKMVAATDYRHALKLCISLSKYKHNHELLACDLDMKGSHFSKCLNGTFHFPGDKIPVIEKLCGNTAITQWLASQHNATLHVETLEEKVKRLEAELAKVAA